MAKTKAELLDEAKALGLKVSEKNTIAEITALLAGMSQTPVEAAESGDLETVEAGEAEEKKLAKAGKRSEKGRKDAEAKVVKTEAQKHREKESAEESEKPKRIVKPARSRLERRSKGYKKVHELIEENKLYSVKEAVELAPKTSPVKFDASVEFHIRLGVDPRQADQNVRDTVVLPAGTGKTVRIAVFTEADKVDEAKKAGADVVGADEFLQQLDKGTLDFDVLITSPNLMPKLGKYARVLGPKGLMPNPKSGTVTPNIAKAITEAKAGRVEYRVDAQGIIHVAAGKVSFTPAQLLENSTAILSSIKGNKPSSLKGNYVKSIFVTTSMGPSIPVDPSSL